MNQGRTPEQGDLAGPVQTVPARAPAGVLPGIQYLRGLCAVLVVVSHANGFLAFPQYFGRSVVASLHEAAVFSVAAFFAISGFIIVVTSFDDRGAQRVDLARFARRRLARIVPFLWVCTAGYAALRFAGTGDVDPGSLLRTLVLWPTGELRPNVAWSLRHEAAFYAIFALTMLGKRKWPAVMLAWLLAPLPYAWWVEVAGPMPSDLDPWSAGAAFANVAGGGENGANLQFLVGMAIGYLHLRGHLRGNWPAWIMLAAFAGSCAVILAAPIEAGIARRVLWTALAGIVVYAAGRTRPAADLADRAGRVLGDASFSIYLVHNMVMLVILELTMRTGLAALVPGQLAAYLCFCVVVSVAACCAVHHSIERPLIAAANRLGQIWPVRARKETGCG